MKTRKLIIEQADKKLGALKPLQNLIPPHKGWLHYVRTALKMSLRQLGERLNVSPQSIKEMEEREIQGTVTVKSLRDAAQALDMKLVYGFVPRHESIEKMIERRATDLAREIVLRTSQSMVLEDQENSRERISNSIKEKAEELKNKMPKYLWD